MKGSSLMSSTVTTDLAASRWRSGMAMTSRTSAKLRERMPGKSMGRAASPRSNCWPDIHRPTSTRERTSSDTFTRGCRRENSAMAAGVTL